MSTCFKVLTDFGGKIADILLLYTSSYLMSIPCITTDNKASVVSYFTYKKIETKKGLSIVTGLPGHEAGSPGF